MISKRWLLALFFVLKLFARMNIFKNNKTCTDNHFHIFLLEKTNKWS